MALPSPTLSVPLKTTTEIDWVTPLKNYIRSTYGDPDRYSEECNTLNRLRQDMRGAGRDSASGRDLLYRYYGQLELLDLRFPVDEHHIKISFTWYDAFTHKQTAQYSLAYEKASIIFNISSVLSCHAANQNRSEDLGLKTAYHSFQASAGMFTYINDNFLHAPSTDLSRDTVKTLIHVMLAQAQEVFLEKQIRDDKKVGMLAKLAAQAASLYGDAIAGVQENVQKGIFEKVWLMYIQIKHDYFCSVSHYYQALAENDASSYGTAISRLMLAEVQVKDAMKIAGSFPHNPPVNSNFNSETGFTLVEMTKRHAQLVEDKLNELIKDNDYIYHQPIPSEAALPVIPKLPAAKPISVQELYAGQDIHKIIGPDIFAKIVPMSVTESASMYDEEKAKLVRAETEKVDLADAEMTTSLDYLNLPHSLKVLKGGFENNDLEVDDQYRQWMEDMSDRGESLDRVFEGLKSQKKKICEILDASTKALDQEESVCEKMRNKYFDEWTQQPSSRLTVTLRGDIKSYREAIEDAVVSDNQLFGQYRMVRDDIEEMRLAAENGLEDDLFRRALDRIRATNGGPRSGADRNEHLLDLDEEDGGMSVLDQIARVEDLLKKLNVIKRERRQVLKDLKEKVHTDDISNVLILNKKSAIDTQLFDSELEKFRPHQTRLMQFTHKQAALMKELTLAYGDLLQDKRIRAERSLYDTLARQRQQVLSRFKKTHQAYLDIIDGLSKATQFYNEMKETVDSLQKNVDTFVNNRRNEGAQLLTQIETGKGAEAEKEQKRLKELMDKMSMGPPRKNSGPSRPSPLPINSTAPPQHSQQGPPLPATPSHPTSPPQTPRYQNQYINAYAPGTPPPQSAGFPPNGYPYGYPAAPPNTGRRESYSQQGMQQQIPHRDSYGQLPRRESYQNQPTTPGLPPQRQAVPPSPAATQSSHPYQPHLAHQPYPAPNQPYQYNPGAYAVPPPPPGPPPAGQRVSYPQQPQQPGYPPQQQQPPPQQPGQYQQPPVANGQGDPWSSLAGWR